MEIVIVNTLGPTPSRLVESGRFLFLLFSPSLREKKRCWRDRSRKWLLRPGNLVILAGDCSCAFKTQKMRGKLRIGPTCGVKATFSERRVTSTSTCTNFLVESTASVGPSDRPSHTHSFTHQPHEDMPYVPFRCHLKADGNSHEFGVDQEGNHWYGV